MAQAQPVQERTLPIGPALGVQYQLIARLRSHSELSAATLVAVGCLWRLWLAHATFFNVDEAWHYSLGNQRSALLAYRASLTINHPPLLILVLHFWRVLGTSNLVLRLPSVIAGTIFCWVFYKWLGILLGRAAAWAGLFLVTFLPPMIAMSADLRQYTLLLMFSVSAGYFLERALAANSVLMTVASSLCLYLAMLSHYSAFFFAAALGVYSFLRIRSRRLSKGVLVAWVVGQALGVALAGLLYVTHIARLSSLVNRATLPQQYLYDWYFHKGKDHLLPFLYHGTVGIFRFTFGQTRIGHLATVLFATGVVLLLKQKESSPAHPPVRMVGILLLSPFALNCVAAAAELYPYGRMRQCVFLAIFSLAGVSICLAKIARQRTVPAIALAIGIVFVCQVFGTLQDRDMLPFAEQRHEHMDQALQFIRSHVMQADVIFTDKSSSFQLGHYLCRQKPVNIERSVEGFESFRCEGFRVVSTGSNDGALVPETFAAKSREMERRYGLNSTLRVWVVQAGWASGLGEALRSRFPAFSQLEPHAYGRYIEVFQLPPLKPASPATPQQR